MTKIDLSNFNPDPKLHKGDFVGHDHQVKFYYRKIAQITRHIESQIKNNEIVLIQTLINNQIIYVNYFSYFSPNMIVIDGVDITGKQTIALISHNKIEISYKIIEPIENEDENKKFIGFMID